MSKALMETVPDILTNKCCKWTLYPTPSCSIPSHPTFHSILSLYHILSQHSLSSHLVRFVPSHPKIPSHSKIPFHTSNLPFHLCWSASCHYDDIPDTIIKRKHLFLVHILRFEARQHGMAGMRGGATPFLSCSREQEEREQRRGSHSLFECVSQWPEG